MSIQGRRLIEIVEEVKARGVMTVVGGPMATVEPEVLEGSGRRRLCRRGGRHLAAIPARVGRGPSQEPLRAAGEDRRDAAAAAAHRPAQDRPLHVRQPADLARLSLHLRVLRHHRHLRPASAPQDQRAGSRRARSLPARRDEDRLRRRRQSDRQQEGDQAGAARHRPLAAGARLSAHACSPRHRSISPRTRS